MIKFEFKILIKSQLMRLLLIILKKQNQIIFLLNFKQNLYSRSQQHPSKSFLSIRMNSSRSSSFAKKRHYEQSSPFNKEDLSKKLQKKLQQQIHIGPNLNKNQKSRHQSEFNPIQLRTLDHPTTSLQRSNHSVSRKKVDAPKKQSKPDTLLLQSNKKQFYGQNNGAKLTQKKMQEKLAKYNYPHIKEGTHKMVSQPKVSSNYSHNKAFGNERPIMMRSSQLEDISKNLSLQSHQSQQIKFQREVLQKLNSEQTRLNKTANRLKTIALKVQNNAEILDQGNAMMKKKFEKLKDNLKKTRQDSSSKNFFIKSLNFQINKLNEQIKWLKQKEIHRSPLPSSAEQRYQYKKEENILNSEKQQQKNEKAPTRRVYIQSKVHEVVLQPTQKIEEEPSVIIVKQVSLIKQSPNQSRERCQQCDKYFEQIRELKLQIMNNCESELQKEIDRLKNLEIEHLKTINQQGNKILKLENAKVQLIETMKLIDDELQQYKVKLESYRKGVGSEKEIQWLKNDNLQMTKKLTNFKQQYRNLIFLKDDIQQKLISIVPELQREVSSLKAKLQQDQSLIKELQSKLTHEKILHNQTYEQMRESIQDLEQENQELTLLVRKHEDFIDNLHSHYTQCNQTLALRQKTIFALQRKLKQLEQLKEENRLMKVQLEEVQNKKIVEINSLKEEVNLLTASHHSNILLIASQHQKSSLVKSKSEKEQSYQQRQQSEENSVYTPVGLPAQVQALNLSKSKLLSEDIQIKKEESSGGGEQFSLQRSIKTIQSCESNENAASERNAQSDLENPFKYKNFYFSSTFHQKFNDSFVQAVQLDNVKIIKNPQKELQLLQAQVSQLTHKLNQQNKQKTIIEKQNLHLQQKISEHKKYFFEFEQSKQSEIKNLFAKNTNLQNYIEEMKKEKAQLIQSLTKINGQIYNIKNAGVESGKTFSQVNLAENIKKSGNDQEQQEIQSPKQLEKSIRKNQTSELPEIMASLKQQLINSLSSISIIANSFQLPNLYLNNEILHTSISQAESHVNFVTLDQNSKIDGKNPVFLGNNLDLSNQSKILLEGYVELISSLLGKLSIESALLQLIGQQKQTVQTHSQIQNKLAKEINLEEKHVQSTIQDINAEVFGVEPVSEFFVAKKNCQFQYYWNDQKRSLESPAELLHTNRSQQNISLPKKIVASGSELNEGSLILKQSQKQDQNFIKSTESPTEEYANSSNNSRSTISQSNQYIALINQLQHQLKLVKKQVQMKSKLQQENSILKHNIRILEQKFQKINSTSRKLNVVHQQLEYEEEDSSNSNFEQTKQISKNSEISNIEEFMTDSFRITQRITRQSIPMKTVQSQQWSEAQSSQANYKLIEAKQQNFLNEFFNCIVSISKQLIGYIEEYEELAVSQMQKIQTQIEQELKFLINNQQEHFSFIPINQMYFAVKYKLKIIQKLLDDKNLNIDIQSRQIMQLKQEIAQKNDAITFYKDQIQQINQIHQEVINQNNRIAKENIQLKDQIQKLKQELNEAVISLEKDTFLEEPKDFGVQAENSMRQTTLISNLYQKETITQNQIEKQMKELEDSSRKIILGDKHQEKPGLQSRQERKQGSSQINYLSENLMQLNSQIKNKNGSTSEKHRLPSHLQIEKDQIIERDGSVRLINSPISLGFMQLVLTEIQNIEKNAFFIETQMQSSLNLMNKFIKRKSLIENSNHPAIYCSQSINSQSLVLHDRQFKFTNDFEPKKLWESQEIMKQQQVQINQQFRPLSKTIENFPLNQKKLQVSANRVVLTKNENIDVYRSNVTSRQGINDANNQSLLQNIINELESIVDKKKKNGDQLQLQLQQLQPHPQTYITTNELLNESYLPFQLLSNSKREGSFTLIDQRNLELKI